jgi:hypothetical protein
MRFVAVIFLQLSMDKFGSIGRVVVIVCQEGKVS